MIINGAVMNGVVIDGSIIVTLAGGSGVEWVIFGWSNEWGSPGDAVTEIYPVPGFKGPVMPLLLSMVQAEAPGGAPPVQGEWVLRSWPNEWVTK